MNEKMMKKDKLRQMRTGLMTSVALIYFHIAEA
jgi:hypothetical protein